ncbi:MAG: archaemetzincin family Zn-dependent metalloprotease [Promethearchaeota archaeon]
MKKIISLLKIGQVDQSIINDLKSKIELTFKEFNIAVENPNNTVPLNNSEYNIQRRQYDASKMLYRIVNYTKNNPCFRILGIINNDIFTSSLNFVFGLAMSPQRHAPGHRLVALISLKRLNESFYRRTDNNELFEVRVLKEAIHELGHTFNLGHCNNYCIMRFSNSLSDTDEKPPSFCDSCLEQLTNFFANLNTFF